MILKLLISFSTQLNICMGGLRSDIGLFSWFGGLRLQSNFVEKTYQKEDKTSFHMLWGIFLSFPKSRILFLVFTKYPAELDCISPILMKLDMNVEIKKVHSLIEFFQKDSLSEFSVNCSLEGNAFVGHASFHVNLWKRAFRVRMSTSYMKRLHDLPVDMWVISCLAKEMVAYWLRDSYRPSWKFTKQANHNCTGSFYCSSLRLADFLLFQTTVLTMIHFHLSDQVCFLQVAETDKLIGLNSIIPHFLIII